MYAHSFVHQFQLDSIENGNYNNNNNNRRSQSKRMEEINVSFKKILYTHFILYFISSCSGIIINYLHANHHDDTCSARSEYKFIMTQ